MIVWIRGQSKSGKTTLGKKMQSCMKNAIRLDGDDMRTVWKIGLTKEDRWEHNIRIAKLAKLLDDQGVDVIVSVICPYLDLKKQVQEITKCYFIELEGGIIHPDYPYET